jgi:hypothetical protein
VATAYKGRDVEIETRLADGQSVRLLVPADVRVIPTSGDAVGLVWRPNRPMLIADA